jgi:hypothetical protein
VLGCELGNVLGAKLGRLLGDALGETLGDVLGDALGVFVGIDVGVAVGLCDGTVHTIVIWILSSPMLAVDEINLTPNVKRSFANNVQGTVNVMCFLSEAILLKVASISAKVPDPEPAATKLLTSM